MIIVGVSSSAQAHDSRWLGDGRISSGPKTDHLFSCQQNFNPNAPGAHRTGSWLQGDRYHPHEKLHVNGKVDWPNARINIVTEEGMRIVRANNLPTHLTGEFPIRQSDPAYQYDRNPNSIREQKILMHLPLMPKFAQSPSCVPMGLIAFTLVGGAFYNAVDAGGRDAAAAPSRRRGGGGAAAGARTRGPAGRCDAGLTGARAICTCLLAYQPHLLTHLERHSGSSSTSSQRGSATQRCHASRQAP